MSHSFASKRTNGLIKIISTTHLIPLNHGAIVKTDQQTQRTQGMLMRNSKPKPKAKPRPKAETLLLKEKEKDIQAGIIEAAGYLGWRLWHFDAGAVRRATHGESPAHGGVPPAGWPDLCGLTPWGKFVAIEVKCPGEEPSEAQHAVLAGLRKMNALADWFTSIDQAITFIKAHNARQARTLDTTG